jgi:ABC-2 type transport system permease protein
LAFAPLAGIDLSVSSVLAVLGVELVIAFSLANLGLVIAWRMDSTQGFHAVMNLILLPLWLLSGAVFPTAGASSLLAWLMTLNPLAYGVAALRHALYQHQPAAVGNVPGVEISVAVMLFFAAATFVAATHSARRSSC